MDRLLISLSYHTIKLLCSHQNPVYVCCSWMLGLQSLSIRHTLVGGTLPRELADLPYLETVDVRDTRMTCCGSLQVGLTAEHAIGVCRRILHHMLVAPHAHVAQDSATLKMPPAVA